jgi:hypothetical protein
MVPLVRRGLVAIGFFGALGCGHGPDAPASAPLPAVLVLRIDTVEVSSTKLDSQETWDAREPESDPAAGCKVVAAGVSFFEPISGSAVSALCGLASSPHRERRASDPDLRVRVAAGATTAYSTFAMPDISSASLGYELVVPVRAVPPDGLRVELFDDDKSGAELIGSTRLSVAKLATAFRSPSKLLVVSEGGIRRLEIVVSEYLTAPATSERRPASAQPATLGRQVKAGEVVTVRASGSFKVGSWFDDTLGPAGYPGGDARSYNLKPFKREPHACGIALIGTGTTVDGIAVGREKQFVVEHAGPIRVGLNDSEPGNNEGSVLYEVALRAPTAQEWLSRTVAP